MVANGEGNKPESNKQKRIYGHLDFQPISNLRIVLYGDINFQQDIQDPTNSDKILSNNVTTTALFLGYKEKGKFSVGIENFYQIFQNDLILSSEVEDKNALGISMFGSADISDKFTIVGRYDYYDPQSNSGQNGDSRNLFLAALNYKADTNVWVMPNVVIETYETLSGGLDLDISVTARLTFFYKFL